MNDTADLIASSDQPDDDPAVADPASRIDNPRDGSRTVHECGFDGNTASALASLHFILTGLITDPLTRPTLSQPRRSARLPPT